MEKRFTSVSVPWKAAKVPVCDQNGIREDIDENPQTDRFLG